MNRETGQLKPHEQALAMPMSGDDEKSLRTDIAEHGIKHRLDVTPAGIILDGVHRWRYAQELGLPTVPVEIFDYAHPEEEALHCLQANLKRRHLTEGQKAVLGLDMLPFEEQASARRKAEAATQAAHLKQRDEAGAFTPTEARLAPIGANLGGPPKKKQAPKSTAKVAKAVGTSARTVERVKQIKEKSPELYEQVRSGKMAPTQAKKLIDQEKAISKARVYVPAEGKYAVIVCDPPWNYTSREKDKTNRIVLPYPSMTTEDICAMKVPAADDCILWLWTTNAFMRDAFTVLDAWGFQEKTILTWVKNRMGFGRWLRGQTEHCILAIKGKPVVNLKNHTTVLSGDVREHSRKPDEFFALVEDLCPSTSRVELFAREKREGWESSGAEADKFSGVA